MARTPTVVDRGVGAAGPLGPRAVVHRDLLVADEVEAQRQHRGRDARAARRRDGIAEVHAGRGEGLSEPVGRQERGVGSVEHVVRQVQAARDVAAAQPRAGLGLGAGEAASRSGVERLLAPALHVAPHLPEVAHQRGPAPRGEPPRRRRRGARLDGPPFGPPLAEATVEDGNRSWPKARKVHQTRAALTTPRRRRPPPGRRSRRRARRPGARTGPRPAACGEAGSRDLRWRRCRRTPRPGCAPPRTRARGSRLSWGMCQRPVENPDARVLEAGGEPFGADEGAGRLEARRPRPRRPALAGRAGRFAFRATLTARRRGRRGRDRLPISDMPPWPRGPFRRA